MQIKPLSERNVSVGWVCMIWGASKVGKTYNSMLTLPKPLLVICVENRDPTVNYELMGRPEGIDIPAEELTTFDDMRNLLTEVDLSKYKSILFDSLTYFMDTLMLNEITAQAFEARKEKAEKSGEKIHKVLASETKTTEESYGILLQVTNRIFDLLTRLARYEGKVVVITAREDSVPKWDRQLTGAPLLAGKAFGKRFAGLCDAIGYVEPRFENGKPIWPPLVSFEDPQGRGFKCGWTGRHPVRNGEELPVVGPLDFAKFLRLVGWHDERSGSSE